MTSPRELAEKWASERQRLLDRTRTFPTPTESDMEDAYVAGYAAASAPEVGDEEAAINHAFEHAPKSATERHKHKWSFLAGCAHARANPVLPKSPVMSDSAIQLAYDQGRAQAEERVREVIGALERAADVCRLVREGKPVPWSFFEHEIVTLLAKHRGGGG